MKKARFARTVSMLFIAAFAAMATAGDEGGKIEGTWVAVGAISRGKKVPPAEIEKAMVSFTFKDGKYNVKSGGEPMESGTYKVDATKQPATIDLILGEGPDKGKKQLGIFKLEGDTLTLAIAAHGGSVASSGKSKTPPPPLPRPKDFEGKGKNDEVMVFKRGK